MSDQPPPNGHAPLIGPVQILPEAMTEDVSIWVGLDVEAAVFMQGANELVVPMAVWPAFLFEASAVLARLQEADNILQGEGPSQ